MTPQLEIAIAAFFLAIGTAGPPLELPRILIAALLCLVVWRAGKFVGAIAMIAVIACAYLQHNQFRLTSLAAATLLGILAHFFYRRPRATTVIMAVSALTGLAFLFLG
jgi:uncharacterized membrane protein YjjB (DUF3815 family)